MHLAFCPESGEDDYTWIEFYQAQSAVGVVAEANLYGWWPITILALNADKDVIGAYTTYTWFGTAARSNFLGLMSPTNNIKYVLLYTGSDEFGFGFTDLQYRSAPGGSWRYWHAPLSLIK